MVVSVYFLGLGKEHISGLSRDPENANNPLTPIFDRDKVLEKQEAAALFGELAFTAIGNLASKMNWAEGSAEKVALHALVGGLMAEINGGKFGDGLTVGAINELIVGELSKLRDENGKLLISSDAMRWISASLGAAVNSSQGANIADSATRNNYSMHYFREIAKNANEWEYFLSFLSLEDQEKLKEYMAQELTYLYDADLSEVRYNNDLHWAYEAASAAGYSPIANDDNSGYMRADGQLTIVAYGENTTDNSRSTLGRFK